MDNRVFQKEGDGYFEQKIVKDFFPSVKSQIESIIEKFLFQEMDEYHRETIFKTIRKKILLFRQNKIEE